MMTKYIILKRKFLHPKQIRANFRIVIGIHIPFLIVVKRIEDHIAIGIITREHEIFVLLHCEEELPTLILLVSFVNDGKSLHGAGCGLVERNDILVQLIERLAILVNGLLAVFVEFGLAVDGHVMVVARVHEIYRLLVAILIKNWLAFLIALIVQCLGIANSCDGYAFDADTLLLVEPNRVFVKVGERFLGIATKLFEPLLKYFLYMLIYNLVYLQIGVTSLRIV